MSAGRCSKRTRGWRSASVDAASDLFEDDRASQKAPLILPALLVESRHSAGSLRGTIMRSIALGAIASLIALSCARAGLPSDWRDHQTAFGQSAFTIKIAPSAAGRRPGLRSEDQGDPAYELRKAFVQATTSTPAGGRSAGAAPSRKGNSQGATRAREGRSLGAAPAPGGRSPGAAYTGQYVPPPNTGGGGGSM